MQALSYTDMTGRSKSVILVVGHRDAAVAAGAAHGETRLSAPRWVSAVTMARPHSGLGSWNRQKDSPAEIVASSPSLPNAQGTGKSPGRVQSTGGRVIMSPSINADHLSLFYERPPSTMAQAQLRARSAQPSAPSRRSLAMPAGSRSNDAGTAPADGTWCSCRCRGGHACCVPPRPPHTPLRASAVGRSGCRDPLAWARSLRLAWRRAQNMLLVTRRGRIAGGLMVGCSGRSVAA